MLSALNSVILNIRIWILRTIKSISMEKDKILLDASFVIALYYQADPQYTEANAFFEMHADSRFYLLESTLREILTVLTYRGGSQFACTCLSDIQDAFDCVILGDDFFEELAFFR